MLGARLLRNMPVKLIRTGVVGLVQAVCFTFGTGVQLIHGSLSNETEHRSQLTSLTGALASLVKGKSYR